MVFDMGLCNAKSRMSIQTCRIKISALIKHNVFMKSITGVFMHVLAVTQPTRQIH